MKYLIIIFLLLLSLTAQSQWQNVGNAERIKAYNTEIKDFVISDNNKFIYTLDGTGTIKTWDYETGDSISSISNKQDSRYPTTGNWIFLSSDGKTYCTAYYYLNYQTIESFSFYIFNLINYQLIDSIYFRTGGMDCCKPEFTIVDFDSLNKKIIYGYNYNWTDCTSGKWGGFDGGTVLKIKNDTDWTTKMSIGGGTDFIYSNNKQSLFFMNPSTFDWSTAGGQGYSSNGTTKYTLCNSDSGNIFVLSQYSHSLNNDGSSSSSGTLHDYNSGIFINNSRYLLLSEKNKIYTYDLNNIPSFKIDTLKEFSIDQKIVLSNTTGDNLFYLIEDNSINIYTIDNFICCKTIEIDDNDLIRKTRNSKDNPYLFFSDNHGYLYKILIELKANFQANKTVSCQFDTVKFYNLSLGFPDSFFWDFGDGTISSEESPIHVYTSTGLFEVKLIVAKNGKNDTLTKIDYINILPYLKADFDYTLSGDFPAILTIKNNSLGQIDSVSWLINDSTRSKEWNPIFEFFQTNIYNIKLTVFSGESQSSLAKEIDIKVIPPSLDLFKFSYEYSDTSIINALAIKGYEDKDGYLIYHIDKNPSYYHGAYHNFIKSWEDTISSGKDFLIQKKLGSYSYLIDDEVLDYDLDGNITNNHKLSFLGRTFSFTSFDENLFITKINHPYVTLFELNQINEQIKSTNLFLFEYISCSNLITFLNKAFIDKLRLDYIINFHLLGKCGQYNWNLAMMKINSYEIPFIKATDFIRLNDSILIITSNESLRILKNYGVTLDTSIKVPNFMEELYNNTYSNYLFRQLLKLNDSSFIVAGSQNNSPAYIIFNADGEIIQQTVIDTRFGGFEFASITPDNNILFSGYGYLEYNKKYPYFVKTNDTLIRILISGEAYPNSIKKDVLVFNLTTIPNPTNDITQIQFELKRDAVVHLKIYNSFGSCIYKSEVENLQSGENSFSVDFTLYSIGYYYYVIEANGSPYLGKIVYLR
ncbi:MAG: PKD domain-containing protein [bacterium]